MTTRSVPMRTLLLRLTGCLLLGVVAGAVGTVAHRMTLADVIPIGVVLALALTGTTAVLTRAWAGGGGLLATAVGWVVIVQLMALEGPGGDVIIAGGAAGGAVGYVWSYGGLVVLGIAAFAPRRWFSDVAPAAPAAPVGPDEDEPAGTRGLDADTRTSADP
ncbi:hypothetical protein GCM10025865_02460 [Paraoerskovia sediminicola]|uniref:N-acetyl-1-D-myo-inositol-2-amino-2-deoxy-alpha-D-glucopyranoside deacetylase n=1 Tax=Paraoerskovia sediminicola TaxID=1138587 RepID=A0ABM8FYX1_9CELL|nr:hypothetical protein [Paraoerskovia sediminicola]BDZ40947.1 hypothetical protein GCM10025865_02460 [Paraoerskovia sediminicola]